MTIGPQCSFCKADRQTDGDFEEYSIVALCNNQTQLYQKTLMVPLSLALFLCRVTHINELKDKIIAKKERKFSLNITIKLK